MATLKLKKYPKKPKASASVATKERYLQKTKEIDKENTRRKSEKAKSAKLSKAIAGVGRAK